MDNGNKIVYDAAGSLKKNILTKNPLLIQGIGFSPAVAAAFDLKIALGIGALTLISVIITGAIVSLMRKIITDRAKILLFAVLCAGTALLEESLTKALFPSLFDRLGVLFPFVAFNGFVILFVNSFAMKNDIGITVIDAFFNGAGFVVALCVFASAREILANGTIFGAKLFGAGFTGVAFFAHPAGIMVLAGFAAALFKALGCIGNKKNGGKREND